MGIYIGLQLFFLEILVTSQIIDRPMEKPNLVVLMMMMMMTTTMTKKKRHSVCASVFVLPVRQLTESSLDGQSASERILHRIMTNYEPDVKPENGQPDEALKVEFGFVVQCAYLDQSDGQLKTRGLELMVRKTNGG